MTASHLSLIRQQPCVACDAMGCHAHHAVGGSMVERVGVRGAATKASDYLALSLCPAHHQGDCGIHTLGVKTWERRYGEQAAHLDRLGRTLGLDLFALAHEEAEQERAGRRQKPIVKKHRPYQPPKKQVPRK